MIAMKLFHIIAISVWSGSLICLPALYFQRIGVVNKSSLDRLHALVRFLYVGVLSPAAFMGVVSGTALIFLRETFDTWFTVKLYLVGVMAFIHVMTGLVILRLFNEAPLYPAWRFVAITALTILVIALILFIVLAKPEIPDFTPAIMHEPGGLQRITGDIIAWSRS